MWESSSPHAWLCQHKEWWKWHNWTEQNSSLAAYTCLKQCKVTILFPCRALSCTENLHRQFFLATPPWSIGIFQGIASPGTRKEQEESSASEHQDLDVYLISSDDFSEKNKSFSDTRSLRQDKPSQRPKSHQRFHCFCSYDKWPMLHKFSCTLRNTKWKAYSWACSICHWQAESPIASLCVGWCLHYTAAPV